MMANPKVIIADTDVNYIAPLQYKFINEYLNNIDLEIITDRNYFAEYFSEPKSAAILIVSEDLYDNSIKRHDIKNVFVMSENIDDGATGDLSITKLYKYTSIMEIFSEVVAKSASELVGGAVEKKETQIVLVTSACGGVGKTTIAMGLAASLAAGYQKVLYINAAMLQNFQYLLEDKEQITGASIYSALYSPTDNVFLDIKSEIKNDGFDYLPEFKAALPSLGIDFSIFLKIALSAKKNSDYDFIIIDAEATFSEEKLNMLDAADKVILVTDQSFAAVNSTNYLVNNINGITAQKYIFICNKFEISKFNALLATEVIPKFSINEYIEMINDVDLVKPKNLEANNNMRKVAFLVM